MIFQQMRLGISAIPYFHVILTGQSISEIIFQLFKFTRKVKKPIARSFKRKYPFQQVKLGTRVIPLFHGILTGKFIHNIILMILGHIQGH